jgi:hypothetical protein
MTKRHAATKRFLAAAALALAAAGCVTINIYFPAAAAERAADKIIDEVWQLQQDKETGAKPAPSGNGRN